MTDARWTEVLDDVRSAVRHFGLSTELFKAGGFEEGGLEGYKAQMALMHSMESGYTALETAFERILEILGEEKPVGGAYHADLVRRVRRVLPGQRGAIIDDELGIAVDEVRRFRHVARKNYEGFDPVLAGRAVQAAEVVRDRLKGSIERFIAAIDR